ncbi:MAG: Hsp20/alpha crystallin family protein [Victivallales bacterium]|jgi:HSP20 family protein|nr:Hsp20/alpha crystallin family protein [Victivallales bacterium]
MPNELTKADEESNQALPIAQPKADVYEGDDRAMLVAELPGVPKEKVELKVERDRLTIQGDTGKLRFERSFTLNEAIDRDAIEARYSNGVLRVTLPFRKPTSQRISIQAA